MIEGDYTLKDVALVLLLAFVVTPAFLVIMFGFVLPMVVGWFP